MICLRSNELGKVSRKIINTLKIIKDDYTFTFDAQLVIELGTNLEEGGHALMNCNFDPLSKL
jgi:hypothetical protein